MNIKVLACALALSFTYAAHAQVRVHSVYGTQLMTGPFATSSPHQVAIDGDFAIVTSDFGVERTARLFRRLSTGAWQDAGVLLLVNSPGTPAYTDDVEMADGIAAIRIGGVLRIYERSGTGYVESPTAGTPTGASGLAISNRRILAARRGCNYDAAVHEENRLGTWYVSGSVSGAAGPCSDHGAPLDLEGDVALVVNSPTEIREYRRNGTAKVWPQVGTILAQPDVNFTFIPPALDGNQAFTAGGHYYRREGSTWTYQQQLDPLDNVRRDYILNARVRDGKVLSNTYVDELQPITNPYVYVRNAAGGYDHVAVLRTYGGSNSMDVSGNRAIVASTEYYDGTEYVQIFDLPTALVTTAAIANDFEARDVSGWQQTAGSQFALATRSAGTSSGTGTVYRQSSVVDKSIAFLTASDFPDAQEIEADITPTAFACADCWVGFATRFTDLDNHYYVTMRASGRIELKRMTAGTYVTLRSETFAVAPNRTYHVKMIADRSGVTVYVDGTLWLFHPDATLARGRAALITYRARADFDNVYSASTDAFNVANKDFSSLWGNGRDFTYVGGNWTPIEQSGSPDLAFGQTSTTGDARAFLGKPLRDQSISARAKLEAYGPSRSGSWFGLLARWVDSRTHYYLTVRSTGTLDIRKQVNGAITVLRSVPYTATPGQYHDYRFTVVGNELHAYVDGRLVAGAIDNEIPSGQYGLGTYATAATWQRFIVNQP